MKEEILKIIEQQIQTKPYKDEILNHTSQLIDFYENIRAETSDKLMKLLKKYNFETISIFSEYEGYPQVTLFHGSGGLEFWACIDYEGGVSDNDEEFGTVVPEPTVWLNEETFDEKYFDEICDLNYELSRLVIFIWLSTIWQEINGYESGIVFKTLENNSVKQFFFNDFSWDESSNFINYNNKNQRVNRYFENDLSVEVIVEKVKKGL